LYATQEDLEFVKIDGKCKIVCAVCLGQTYEDMKKLNAGPQEDIELAKKVMQFALITDSGFRFVLAHFPVSIMPATSLYEKFCEGIQWCLKADFW
jgi:hypothetical protein